MNTVSFTSTAVEASPLPVGWHPIIRMTDGLGHTIDHVVASIEPDRENAIEVADIVLGVLKQQVIDMLTQLYITREEKLP